MRALTRLDPEDRHPQLQKECAEAGVAVVVIDAFESARERRHQMAQSDQGADPAEPSRAMPRYRPVVATLTLAGMRVSELCALNCEHVDLAHRELRVLDAKTPAGVRRVDIHNDLQEELAAYKAAARRDVAPGRPAFLNARAKRWTRNAIAQHAIPPALGEANRQRIKAALPVIREEVTPHTLRYTCIASLFAAGADQEYAAAQVGHEDVTTTNRIYRYVLQRRQRGASWQCGSLPRTLGGWAPRPLGRDAAEHCGSCRSPSV